MLHRWEERWEHLQLILEVYQFARDAAVAEAWLIAQDPYLKSEELGVSDILFSILKICIKITMIQKLFVLAIIVDENSRQINNIFFCSKRLTRSRT